MNEDKECLGTLINKDLAQPISSNNKKVNVAHWDYKMNPENVKSYKSIGLICVLHKLFHEEKLNAHYLCLEDVCDDDSISKSEQNVKQVKVQKHTDSINKDLSREIREGFHQQSNIKENTTPKSSISQVLIDYNGKKNHCFMLKD